MLKRSIVSIFLSLTLFVLLSNGVSAEQNFKDVDNNTTGHDGIYELVDQGIISGYPDGTFKPYEPISRSQSAVLFQMH